MELALRLRDMTEESSPYGVLKFFLTIGGIAVACLAIVVAMEWKSSADRQREELEAVAAEHRKERLESARQAFESYRVTLTDEESYEEGRRRIRGKLLVLGADADEMSSMPVGEALAGAQLSSIHALLPERLQASEPSEVGAVVRINHSQQSTVTMTRYGERDELEQLIEDFFEDDSSGTYYEYDVFMHDPADGRVLARTQVGTKAGDPQPIVDRLVELARRYGQ